MLEFHPLAALEVTEAAEYYEDKAPFLGERFLLALQIALDRIELNPRAQAPWTFLGVPEGVRQSIVGGFRHSVIFITEPKLYVVTVRHHSQHPTRWVERLNSI